MVSILATNGGPHPADKWADVSTEAVLGLIEVSEDSVSPEAAAARAVKRQLRGQLFDIFNASHGALQDAHRKSLAKAKTCQKAKPIDVSQDLGAADQVLALLATTPFAAHFAQDHVAETIRQITARDAANIIHIERCCHSDGLAAKGA